MRKQLAVKECEFLIFLDGTLSTLPFIVFKEQAAGWVYGLFGVPRGPTRSIAGIKKKRGVKAPSCLKKNTQGV